MSQGNDTNVNSILDKIIASKEDQEKRDFDPSDVIAQLLKHISDKESDVLQRRFGLAGRSKETLEAIGNSYNVTRERIRQIENLAVKKLKDDTNFLEIVKPIEHVIITVLEEYGEIMSEDHLLDELFSTGRSVSDDQAVSFILAELLDFRFQKVSQDTYFVKAWRTKSTNIDFAKKTIEMLVSIIEAADQPVDLITLYNKVKEHEFYKKN